MAGRPKRYERQHRLASWAQLWRLNEQGLLRIELAEDAFVPGGPPEGWTCIGWEEAKALLARLDDERWVGLPAFPRPGELTVVRSGRVVPLGMALEERVQP